MGYYRRKKITNYYMWNKLLTINIQYEKELKELKEKIEKNREKMIKYEVWEQYW